MRPRLLCGIASAALTLAGGLAIAAPARPGRAPAIAPGHWGELSPSLLRRSEVSAAVVGNAVYVVGGFGADSRSSSAVERLDLRSGRWSRSADMPVALNHMSAVGYGGALYVVGGYSEPTDTSAGAVRDLWRFDPGGRRWTRLRPAPIARAAAGAAVLGHRLYVAGGRSDTLTSISTTAIYDFHTRALVARAPAPPTARARRRGCRGRGDLVARRPSARAGQLRRRRAPPPGCPFLAAHAVDADRTEQLPGGLGSGRIIVVGGEGGGSTFGEVDALDPATGHWSRLPDLPTPRHGLGLVAHGSLVYAIEGGPQAGLTTSRTVEAFRMP